MSRRTAPPAALLALALLAPAAPAQETRPAPAPLPAPAPPPAQPQPPCSAPEARQFDFWVGEWEARWEGGKGTNVVQAALRDCVIHENFRDDDPRGLHGWSVSVWDPRRGKWLQTWVDNSGNYFEFEGEFREGRMVLSREAKGHPTPFQQRMVWYNIGRGAFDWNWERSMDGGKTWELVWKIAYTRKS